MSIERIDTQDVFVPTQQADEELKGGSTLLSPAALELLVLFDGKANLGEVITHAGLDHTVARREAQALADAGLIELGRGLLDVNIDFSYFFGPASGKPSGAALQQAEAEADGGAQRLSLDGYYVSIARRAADAPPRKPNAPALNVLAVEDEEAMQRMLKFLLGEAGFAPQIAGNREEIVAALRSTPSPDAILLDVMLPDTNGFDVLAKIKQHPLLKKIPVVMLTAKATREDVLRGLASGADGYITKPFDHDILITGVRAVLGLR